MQKPLLNSIEPITNDGLMNDKFRGVVNKLTNKLPIVSTGSPEGAISAFQYSYYIDSDLSSGCPLWVKRLTDIGGDVTKGWARIEPINSIKNYLAKTATYTILATDYCIDCNGTFTVNLPTAVGRAGQEYVVKNSGAGVITLDGNGTETIDGALTQAIIAGVAMRVISDGANWIMV